MLNHIIDEKNLLIAFGVCILAVLFNSQLAHTNSSVALVISGFFVATIIAVSLRVSYHAEVLAEKVGDPYGSMILTLSAVIVEVVILAIMIQHEHSATLARDTIYAAVMLDINGILGCAALLGGLKHGEQAYNDHSSRSYSVMILTAMGIAMVVPEFIPVAKWHIYSYFTIFCMLMLYFVFLRMQTGQHSYFFSYSYPDKNKKRWIKKTADTTQQPSIDTTPRSIGILLIGVILIAALTELMSPSLKIGVQDLSLPPMILAIVVASISASPEILTALRAALANHMQSTINIALGASLSTVILTVPVMEAIALYNHQPMQLAMTPLQTIMIFITLLVAAINLNDGQTNAIEGITHFALFLTFLMLACLGL